MKEYRIFSDKNKISVREVTYREDGKIISINKEPVKLEFDSEVELLKIVALIKRDISNPCRCILNKEK